LTDYRNKESFNTIDIEAGFIREVPGRFSGINGCRFLFSNQWVDNSIGPFFERYKRLEDDVIQENIRTSGVHLEKSSYMESQRKLANSFHEIMEVMSKLPKF